MPAERFTAFYPSRPFWAVSQIDFDDPDVADKFDELMAEETFKDSDDTLDVRVCRDGLIMISIPSLENDIPEPGQSTPIESLIKQWGKYLDHLNAFYLLLDSAVINKMNTSYFALHEITNRDAFRLSYKNGQQTGYSLATESITYAFQTARLKAFRGPLPIRYDPRIIARQVISKGAIAHATEMFRSVLNRNGIVKQLASFTKSIAEYKVGNYETSIILAWFISERMISEIWSRHIDSLNLDIGDQRKRINAKRKEFLTSGRDFPVSVTSNCLELFGFLPFQMFDDLDKVRGYRNAIVHKKEGYVPTNEHARLAIKAANELFGRTYSIEFTPSLSYSITGL
jgi:hypothetical protein